MSIKTYVHKKLNNLIGCNKIIKKNLKIQINILYYTDSIQSFLEREWEENFIKSLCPSNKYANILIIILM